VTVIDVAVRLEGRGSQRRAGVRWAPARSPAGGTAQRAGAGPLRARPAEGRRARVGAHQDQRGREEMRARLRPTDSVGRAAGGGGRGEAARRRSASKGARSSCSTGTSRCSPHLLPSLPADSVASGRRDDGVPPSLVAGGARRDERARDHRSGIGPPLARSAASKAAEVPRREGLNLMQSASVRPAPSGTCHARVPGGRQAGSPGVVVNARARTPFLHGQPARPPHLPCEWALAGGSNTSAGRSAEAIRSTCLGHSSPPPSGERASRLLTTPLPPRRRRRRRGDGRLIFRHTTAVGDSRTGCHRCRSET